MTDSRSHSLTSNLKSISMIEKYNCLDFYFNLKDCIIKSTQENECREEYMKIGECVISGMKKEEQMISSRLN